MVEVPREEEEEQEPGEEDEDGTGPRIITGDWGEELRPSPGPPSPPQPRDAVVVTAPSAPPSHALLATLLPADPTDGPTIIACPTSCLMQWYVVCCCFPRRIIALCFHFRQSQSRSRPYTPHDCLKVGRDCQTYGPGKLALCTTKVICGRLRERKKYTGDYVSVRILQ